MEPLTEKDLRSDQESFVNKFKEHISVTNAHIPGDNYTNDLGRHLGDQQ